MAEHRITLVVEGLESDDGHVRLEAFVEQLIRIQAALAKLDKSMSGGKRNSHFVITGLSHSSPATAEIEARVNQRSRDIRQQLIGQFSNVMDAVERNDFSVNIDYSILEDLKALAAPVGSTIKSSELRLNGSVFHLTDRLSKRIDAHLADQDECPSTVEGMLEKINVHDDTNAFTIYPDVGPTRISCHFPQDLQELAMSAIKRRVAVTGVAKYRKYSPFPHHMDVTAVEIYAPESQLPTFGDLRGIAPDATGEMSSEQFVRGLRDGWH